MYKLILENQYGNSIEITHNRNYAIYEISGLHPPNAIISTDSLAIYDGEKFTSSKADKRTINIQFGITKNAETNRIALYKIIKTKQYIRLNYKNGIRDIFIEGYVESMIIDYHVVPQLVTVSILCPKPYFNDATELISEMSALVKKFTFPFAIEKNNKIPFGYIEDVTEINVINNGDIQINMIIKIQASGEVINPTIFNRETGEFFSLNFTMQTGDVITIDTNQGQKSVNLYRNGENINIFNSISRDSTWISLYPGDNIMIYDADNETRRNMLVRFLYRYQYEGV